MMGCGWCGAVGCCEMNGRGVCCVHWGSLGVCYDLVGILVTPSWEEVNGLAEGQH